VADRECAGGGKLHGFRGRRQLAIAELKKQWRELFSEEPPAFNRRYLESRLAFRIQELA
jgi:hypothetical protein